MVKEKNKISNLAVNHFLNNQNQRKKKKLWMQMFRGVLILTNTQMELREQLPPSSVNIA